ncbi:nucleotide disphospho-sugar-binding domain-containing protein [Amycolatopsis sp. cmx-4-68]|uniref:nucleotide disphospho-sugar-binding domain-containing protein n=1 Tax=Amycolatopsis sp. cmx-4-68 TaxID=2790938 RepID=UPI00397A62BD
MRPVRVLFTTYPEATVFQPMVPLAWALRTAGHEVRVAAQPAFAATITAAGLTAVPVGRERTNTWRRLLSLDPAEAEADRAGLPSPYDAAVRPAGVATMTAGYERMIEHGHKLNNFALVPGLVEFARAWRPDLVIWEATTYAGAIAAKACGAAHARFLWSLDVFGVTRERFLALGPDSDPLADWLGSYGRKYGFDFDESLITGEFTLDALPGSLRLDADLDYRSMQYVPYNGPSAVPDWLQRRGDRPRIGLTLGTSATEQFAGYTVSVKDILTELSTLDVEVVATVADDIGSVPDNARVVPFVPLDALAPTCDVVIDHAGPGTFLTVARHGVPQLTVPWTFDEPALAARAAAQGGSLTLPGDQATPSAIREHVLRLLNEPEFRERAAALRTEIRALPTPNELAHELAR